MNLKPNNILYMEPMRPINNGLNSGLVYERPQPDVYPKDHVVGAVNLMGLPVLKPKPQKCFDDAWGWLFVKTKNMAESQVFKNFDSFSCTVYAILKALAKQIKYVYGEDIDLDESFTAVMSGVIPGRGNTIRNVMESVRLDGPLDEQYRMALWKEMDQRVFFAAATAIQKAKALEWLKRYDVYWDWIDTSDNVPTDKIIEALHFTPIVVTVYAWASYYGNQGVFYDYNYGPNHASTIVGAGVVPQKVKDLFKDRPYPIDWNLVDKIADDSYRFDWAKDEPDHTEYNDFLKPLAKEFRIWSAHRIYAVAKANDKKKTFSLTLKNMSKYLWSYADSKGVYFFFVKEINGVLHKQQLDISKLPPELTILKGLFVILGETDGATRKTSYGEISQIPNHKFF